MPGPVGGVSAVPGGQAGRAYVMLQLPHGPSLWRHAVLPFGSTSSVWFFNTCTDALVFSGRCPFVDDIGCPDTTWSASSSFTAFSEMCDLLGIRLKPSKAQEPSPVQKLFGVIISVTSQGI